MESEKKPKTDGVIPKGKHNNKEHTKEHPDKKLAAIDRQKSEQEPVQRDGPKAKQSNRDAAPKEKKEEAKPAPTGPVIHVNKDLSAGAKWAKGNGPSFADMVRHKNEPTRKPQAAPEAPKREERERKQQPHPKAEAEAPQRSKQATPPPPTPPPAVAAPAAEPPVASHVPEAHPPAPEVQPPAPTTTFYVLEVERVDAVKLPAHVTKAAAGRTLTYTFSAQPGNPPPPVPATQPQTIFRPDAANLNQRQWTASDARAPNQWAFNGQGADWSMQGDRNYNAPRAGGNTFQYNSYAAPAQQQAAAAAQQQQVRGNHNFFPNRLRPETGAFGGGRAAGGGVW